MENWLKRVKEEIPLVNNYDKTAIEDSLPDLIDALIEKLESEKLDNIISQSIKHGWQRTQHDAYSMKHIIKEYNLLMSEILNTVDNNSETTSIADRNTIINAINYAIENSAEAFYVQKQNVLVNIHKLAEMKADQLQIEDKNREEFIQSIIHDLNSPLNNIQSCITMLERDLEAGEVKQILEILKASSKQAEVLIEDFLDVGSVDSFHNLPVNKEKVNILDALEQQIKIFRISFRRDIVLKKTENEVFVELDPTLISRAFNNLMNNALKHGLASKPIIVECNKHDGLLKISVHNEGKEIPENVIKSIFDRYYKTKEATKGWGIGLAFVKKVAEAHGGKVSVESNESGTTFQLEIPINA